MPEARESAAELLRLLKTAKLPRVTEHRARMLARPAVQKAVAAEGTQVP
jgi:hypothetical protein